MNNIFLDRETLEGILKNGNLGKYQEDYDLRTSIYRALLLHSEHNRELFSELISTRFPSEPEYVHRYRLDNFSLITKTYLNKIITTLSKIPRSDDFVVTYKKADLKNFCESNIGYYRSLVRWFFNVGLKYLLVDPNCLYIILPKDIFKKEDTTINYPEINIITSDRLLIYEENYILFKLTNSEFIYLDKTQILKIIKEKDNYIVETILEYEFNELPFVTSGGILFSSDKTHLFDSFISGCLPFWNQALIEYSDKTAAIKQHLYPEKWRYVVGNCNNCQGTGHIIFNQKTETCAICKGTGDPPTGVMSEILIKQSAKNSIIENTIPVPPAGYIQKDTVILDYIDKDIKNNIYSGLAALNMEFLMETPNIESGVAKEMDRQELNAFIYQIASHVSINILKPLYRIIGKWFFYGTEYNSEWINTDVSIPIHYDITSESDIENKIAKARSSNVSSYIIKKLEQKYIEKKFENFNEDKSYLLLINELDTLPAKSSDEKIKIYREGMIDKTSVVASLNIEYIISILNQNVGFKSKSYSDKLALVFEEANKIIKKIEEEDEEDKEENTMGFVFNKGNKENSAKENTKEKDISEYIMPNQNNDINNDNEIETTDISRNS